ncbi:unnamed protein product [Effrenium voratum]|uniref:Uncharacterized protein n=1 Tax=Effrenium voratum TaxID=2562239 RepID=A0AA36IAV2_9DINO|nr:unnamed protein product [Effrenium voratum]
MSAQRLAAARTVGAQLALRNSLKSKDAVRIDQACDAAEHTSVATHEIREGRAMAARLRAEGELYAAISAPSIEQLRKARASGARAGIDAALIREAERKTNQLCQNAILKATGTGCVQAVRAACSEAEHAGAAPSLVHEAMHTIARLQREEAETQLAEAMVSGCAGQIRVASAAAKDQGVSAEQVRQAEETATRIEAEVELAAVLLNAVERSAARLCSAADVIEAVGAIDLHALQNCFQELQTALSRAVRLQKSCSRGSLLDSRILEARSAIQSIQEAVLFAELRHATEHGDSSSLKEALESARNANLPYRQIYLAEQMLKRRLAEEELVSSITAAKAELASRFPSQPNGSKPADTNDMVVRRLSRALSSAEHLDVACAWSITEGLETLAELTRHELQKAVLVQDGHMIKQICEFAENFGLERLDLLVDVPQASVTAERLLAEEDLSYALANEDFLCIQAACDRARKSGVSEERVKTAEETSLKAHRKCLSEGLTHLVQRDSLEGLHLAIQEACTRCGCTREYDDFHDRICYCDSKGCKPACSSSEQQSSHPTPVATSTARSEASDESFGTDVTWDTDTVPDWEEDADGNLVAYPLTTMYIQSRRTGRIIRSWQV